jgi:hypothetical protein
MSLRDPLSPEAAPQSASSTTTRAAIVTAERQLPVPLQRKIILSSGRSAPEQPSAHERTQQHLRHILPLLLAMLLAALLASLFLFTGPLQHSFARPASFETCATVLPRQKPQFCNGQDPILGGCSSDAQTVTQQPILLAGRVVGLAQVRHSPFCDTYWGRGFSFLLSKSISVDLPDLGRGEEASFLSTSSSVYSNMLYQQIPTVTVGIIVSSTTVAQTTIPGVK